MTHSRVSPEPGDDTLPWRRRRPRDAGDFLSPAVRRALAETATSADEVVPFNTVRKRAASALLASKQTAAHALTTVAVDYSRVDAARAGARLTALPFVARAVVDALREFPQLNATAEGDALIVRRAVHLGVAVDLDHQGLVVPVVRHADDLRLPALAERIRDAAARARARRLGPDDLTGGTFTVTNPGAAGTWMSFPILNAPQVGILSTDGVRKQVVAGDHGGLRVLPIGNLCLTFDHRAVDGAYAGCFLARVRDLVEDRDWTTEL
jgi:pyruvate/2-oxoglutarate dehydrogenase complex dihydrolipoamide acyltransferase (E2) component